MDLSGINAVILCGGLGTRLSKLVGDRPKPMADINGQPFLEILIEEAASYGFKRFILCTGHMSGYVEAYFAGKFKKYEILISSETAPLGTAGAIKKAESLINSDKFVAMNGDSLCKLDYNAFMDFHMSKKALCSVALAKAETASDYGTINVDSSGRITGFKEKVISSEPALINAGIYIINKAAVDAIPADTKYSLEKEWMPRMIESGSVYGYFTGKPVLDIGTPERYQKAKNSGLKD